MSIMKNYQLTVLTAAKAYLEDLQSGLEEGIYTEGKEEILPLEESIQLMEKNLPLSFEESPEERQQKILEKQYDINVDYNWWEFTYEDAEGVLCKITSFDLGRSQSIGFEMDDKEETAAKIISEHGEKTDTYKAAFEFQEKRNKLVENTPMELTLKR
jgi:hypothetical protein